MIQKIGHYSLENPASVYDEEALTALELAGRTAGKVNECVDQVNQIPKKIADDVQKHIDNGEFDKQVDKYAGQLSKQIADSEKANQTYMNNAQAEMRNELRITEDSLGNRLDNLLGAGLTPGSTTGDAELVDIRAGGDGKEYGTAGEAVRGQLEKVNADIVRLDDFGTGPMAINPDTIQKGKCMLYNTGQVIADGNYYMSDYIRCEPNEIWTCHQIAHICILDKNKNYLRGYLCATANNYVCTFDTGENAHFIVISKGAGYIPYNGGCSFGKGDTIPDITSYYRTLPGTILDDKQFERKRFIEGLMEGRNIIPVTWERGGFDSTGAEIKTDNIYRTNVFRVPGHVKKFTIANPKGYNIWVIAVDENGSRIWGNSDWVTSAEIEIANDYALYRVEVQQSVNFNKRCTEFVEIYHTQTAEGKTGYQPGYIHFTVPVNQTHAFAIPDNPSYVDVNCILKLPANYSPVGNPSKLVMICHGAGSSVNTWEGSSGYNALVSLFNDNGYAVFDCNGYSNDEAGYNPWGCPRGQECYRKAYDYIIRNYNVEENLSIYGFSMGGLMALNLVFAQFPNVKCVALGSPVVNLKSVGWNDATSTGTPAVMLAYGASLDATTYPESFVRGCDPYENIKTIDGVKMVTKALPPVKIWFGSLEDGSGTGNNFVNKAPAITLATAIRNGGGQSHYREVTGADHAICYGMNATVNNEIIQWVNRFNY